MCVGRERGQEREEEGVLEEGGGSGGGGVWGGVGGREGAGRWAICWTLQSFRPSRDTARLPLSLFEFLSCFSSESGSTEKVLTDNETGFCLKFAHWEGEAFILFLFVFSIVL